MNTGKVNSPEARVKDYGEFIFLACCPSLTKMRNWDHYIAGWELKRNIIVLPLKQVLKNNNGINNVILNRPISANPH